MAHLAVYSTTAVAANCSHYGCCLANICLHAADKRSPIDYEQLTDVVPTSDVISRGSIVNVPIMSFENEYSLFSWPRRSTSTEMSATPWPSDSERNDVIWDASARFINILFSPFSNRRQFEAESSKDEI